MVLFHCICDSIWMLESYSLDDSIEIIADEKGRDVRKSADHPNKTRDMICLDDSENDDDEDGEIRENLNNNSVIMERLTKSTEIHETISISPTIKSGTVKEFLTDLGLGILKDLENGIVLFHCESIWMNGSNASNASLMDIRRYDYHLIIFQELFRFLGAPLKSGTTACRKFFSVFFH